MCRRVRLSDRNSIRFLKMALVMSFSTIFGFWNTYAAAQTAQWIRPAATYPGAIARRAILILSTLPSDRDHEIGVSETAETYRRRLSDLGFETTIIGNSSRAEADRTLRSTFDSIPAGTDLAIFVLGPTISSGQEVFIVTGDAAPVVETAPEPPETEVLRLSQFLRRFQSKNLRNLVLVLDDCRPNSSACTVPDLGASIVSIERPTLESRGPSDDTVERQAILAGITIEGRTFEQFHASLRQMLEPTGYKVHNSTILSRTFQFHESGFFTHVPSDCMKIDPQASEATARSSQIPGLVQGCTTATAQRPFVAMYQDRLAAGREQLAFQNAVASCATETARSAYFAGYPNGRFVQAITRYREECIRASTPLRPDPAPPPPPPPSVYPTQPTVKYHYVDGLDPNGFNWLALRNAPNLNSTWSTTHMRPGTLVTILGESGMFYRVRLPSGEEGWAAKRYIFCCRTN